MATRTILYKNVGVKKKPIELDQYGQNVNSVWKKIIPLWCSLFFRLFIVMSNDESLYAKEALLSCMIGIISTIDLLKLKDACIDGQDKQVCNYYMRSVEDHAKMTIYDNPYIH